MNLECTGEERAFRDAVRDFLKDRLPRDISEHGGLGWTAVQRHIITEECALHGRSRLPAFGPNMLGPVLIKFGTEEQQREILPRILNGQGWLCPGFSEPGAGSDLASLSTRAAGTATIMSSMAALA